MKQIILCIVLVLIFCQCVSIRPELGAKKFDESIIPLSYTSVNVPIEIPLWKIEKRINTELQQQFWSFDGLPIGSGLTLNMEAQPTGKVSLRSLSSQKIGLKLPLYLKGAIKFERKVLGQNLSTQLPFQENFQAELNFSPKLNTNWNFMLQDLEIQDLGSAFRYNLLGFEVDLSTVIKNQFQKYIQSSLEMNQLKVLDIQSVAQQYWNNLNSVSKIQTTGLDAFLITEPDKILLYQELTDDQNLKLILGMTGKMEMRIGEDKVILPKEFPVLEENYNKENGFEVVMPIIVQYAYLEHMINQEYQDKTFRLDAKTDLIPHHIQIQNFGNQALMGFDFQALRKGKKDVKGKMFITAQPIFDAEKQAVLLKNVSIDVQTSNPFTRIGVLSKRRKITRQIQKLAVLPMEEYLSAAKSEIQKQQEIRTQWADVNIINPSLEIIGIYPTEDDLRIMVKSTGQLRVSINGLD
jgi:hypothetical protein